MTNRTHPPTTPTEVLDRLTDVALAVAGDSSDPLAVIEAMPLMPTTPEELPVQIDTDHEIYALQMAGHTPYQIALEQTRKTGQKWTADDVMRSCHRIAAQNVTRSAEQLAYAAQLDLDRVDAMIQVLWPQAQDGNLQAIDRLERMMKRRAEMLGTDAPEVRVALSLNGADAVDLTALSTEELRQYRDLQRKASSAARQKYVGSNRAG